MFFFKKAVSVLFNLILFILWGHHLLAMSAVIERYRKIPINRQVFAYKVSCFVILLNIIGKLLTRRT